MAPESRYTCVTGAKSAKNDVDASSATVADFEDANASNNVSVTAIQETYSRAMEQ